MTAIFATTAATECLPWGIDSAGGDGMLRRVFIEVHDKIALFLTVFLSIHVAKRVRWFTGALRG